MMKYALTAAVAATFTASAAIAGGMNQTYVEPAPRPAQVYAAPASGWTGGYMGGNLSYGTAKVKAANELADYLGEDLTLLKFNGTSGAIRAGYDWQRGAGVFGLGAEYNLGRYKDSFSDGEGGTLNVDIKNAATIFARAGYAVNDNFMAYGLLGYTWAKATASYAGDSERSNLDGGTIGLGGEYKLNSKWSTYGEYTYTNFGSVKDSEGLLETKLGQAKFGVNYRF